MVLLEQAREDIVSGGLGAGNNFTIAASAKAFEVLSSNLYQNKELAVIREIVCNAADAHKMVGKPVTSIEIHMPGYMAPHFAVRDFGPGLSHEDVLSLYTTYFRSTKDQSNDLIGGFGLGSKSPFAVADQFTVTVWQQGEKRQYVCYKSSGVPAINHVGTEASNEPPGLEVRVAVSAGGMYRWEEEARNLFKWWPEVPQGIKKVDYALGPTYSTVQSSRKVGAYPEWALSGYTSEPVVLMGGVPYSLNFDAVAGLPPDVRAAFAGLGLVLAFEVGQLSISPSREALSYDPQTCQQIVGRLKSIYADVKQEIEKQVAAMPSLWEARKFLYSEGRGKGASGLLVRLRNKLAGVQWRGKSVAEHVDVHFQKDFSVPVTLHQKSRASHRKTWDSPVARSYDWRHFVTGPEIVETFVWDDKITSLSYRKAMYASEQEVDTYTDNYGGKRRPTRVVSILTGVPFDEAAKKFDELGLPPLRKVADLPDVPKAAPGSSASRPATKGYVWNASKKEWSRTESAIDLTTGGYYIPFYDGEPVGMSGGMLNHYILFGVVDGSKPIIGLQRGRLSGNTQVKRLLARHRWVALEKSLIHSVPCATIKKEQLAREIQSSNYAWDLKAFMTRVSKWAPIVKDAEFKQFVADLVSGYFAPDPYKPCVIDYAEHFSDVQKGAMLEAVAEAARLKAEWQKFLAKHPLLRHMQLDKVPTDALVEYVNR